jgi:hypothetical protein
MANYGPIKWWCMFVKTLFFSTAAVVKTLQSMLSLIWPLCGSTGDFPPSRLSKFFADCLADICTACVCPHVVCKFWILYRLRTLQPWHSPQCWWVSNRNSKCVLHCTSKYVNSQTTNQQTNSFLDERKTNLMHLLYIFIVAVGDALHVSGVFAHRQEC